MVAVLRRCRCARLCLGGGRGGVCGVAGVPGALQTCLTNFACNSPATISNVEFTALKSQRFQTLLNLHPIELHATFFCAGLEARPGPADTHWCSSRVLLSRALAGTLVGALSRQPVAHGSPTMSHVIPLRVFQTLKSRRWDCNVCGVSRKMTKLNYVRLWGRGLRASSSEPARQSQFSSAT